MSKFCCRFDCWKSTFPANPTSEIFEGNSKGCLIFLSQNQWAGSPKWQPSTAPGSDGPTEDLGQLWICILIPLLMWGEPRPLSVRRKEPVSVSQMAGRVSYSQKAGFRNGIINRAPCSLLGFAQANRVAAVNADASCLPAFIFPAFTGRCSLCRFFS